MKPLRFAVIGTGFWSNYQIAAWKELQGVDLVAVYNRTPEKAKAVAMKYNVPRIYTSVDELLNNESLDFVDIISNVDTHLPFTLSAAKKGVDVICQKPMAPSLADAEQMLISCKNNNKSLFIHENFRWQAPIRALKEVITSGVIGKPFKSRVSFCSAFPVFDNQPFLAKLENFILTDIGSHVLDICRFLFGEAKTLHCLTQRVNKNIVGEDVANVLMEMENGLHCIAEMSYASVLEKETFPQTLILVEGEFGSVNLTNDFELRITTRKRTTSSFIQPSKFSWVDPDYAVVHASIVDCNRNILKGLQGGKSETTGEDNFKTVQLVWACYESAATRQTVFI
ncbi:MAG: Gfo/Idh/MocA family oxidoreductase [Chitinophagaceae bacterium]|nr:Gfo/Idh/MocA family oxidoreductase [Chitinophagaceae bacterium]